MRIPWGSPPYPTNPSLSRTFERIARDARYTLLLSGMRRHGAEVVVFGHHADDQLETFLMRLASGTGFLGLGGIKAVRRFGMGDGSPGEIGWYGVDGIQRWIVRPLLAVSKVYFSL
jgi:tRNA(Ile)-lysidine synthase